MSDVVVQCPPNQSITQIEQHPFVIVHETTSQVVVTNPTTQLLPPPVCPAPQPTPKCESTTTEVVLKGPKGDKGDPGVSVGSAPFIDGSSAEFTPMFKGTPVALVSGQFRRATSLAPFNEVVGLVMDDVIVPGAAGRVQTAGPLEQPALEWEVVTGMPGGLSPGALHFPSSSGHLTPFAPTAQGEFVVPTGRAASPTTFIIDIDTQVQL